MWHVASCDFSTDTPAWRTDGIASENMLNLANHEELGGLGKRVYQMKLTPLPIGPSSKSWAYLQARYELHDADCS